MIETSVQRESGMTDRHSPLTEQLYNDISELGKGLLLVVLIMGKCGLCVFANYWVGNFPLES